MSDTDQEEYKTGVILSTSDPWMPNGRPGTAQELELARTILAKSFRWAINDACSVPWPDEQKRAEVQRCAVKDFENLVLPFMERHVGELLNRAFEIERKFWRSKARTDLPFRVVIEPNEPKRTRVVKHDDKGRILETETYYGDDAS